MVFAQSQFLIGLLLIPLAVLFLVWVNKDRNHSLVILGQRELLQKLFSNVNWRGRRWRAALWLFTLTMFVLSLARPQWGSEIREVQQEGLQVIVALDISQSMLAEDIKPSRLERAKLEIADLSSRLEGDALGLVLFSGASFIQVPLTTDYFTALNYLDNANPGLISRPGTVIGDAIHTALQGFDAKQNNQKVLILVTDGEDRETDPIDAARQAADQDVLIYTIGFGSSEGVPIPETDSYGQLTGYKQDSQGQVVLSRLDEATLQAIADAGNGHYYHAGADSHELDDLLNEIDKLQKAQLQSRFEVRYIERYQIFLALAFLAFLIGELIPDRMNEHGFSSRVAQWWRSPKTSRKDNPQIGQLNG